MAVTIALEQILLILIYRMEKEERIRKLQKEVRSLRDLLARLEEESRPKKSEIKENKGERIDILKRIRERKIIDDDIPPF